MKLGEIMEERITELELRFMHQEKTINDLNETVCRQELAIARLERELGRMREQFLTLSPSINRTSDEEEPPPHY
jgi:SlyX protein